MRVNSSCISISTVSKKLTYFDDMAEEDPLAIIEEPDFEPVEPVEYQFGRRSSARVAQVQEEQRKKREKEQKERDEADKAAGRGPRTPPDFWRTGFPDSCPAPINDAPQALGADFDYKVFSVFMTVTSTLATFEPQPTEANFDWKVVDSSLIQALRGPGFTGSSTIFTEEKTSERAGKLQRADLEETIHKLIHIAAPRPTLLIVVPDRGIIKDLIQEGHQPIYPFNMLPEVELFLSPSPQESWLSPPKDVEESRYDISRERKDFATACAAYGHVGLLVVPWSAIAEATKILAKTLIPDRADVLDALDAKAFVPLAAWGGDVVASATAKRQGNLILSKEDIGELLIHNGYFSANLRALSESMPQDEPSDSIQPTIVELLAKIDANERKHEANERKHEADLEAMARRMATMEAELQRLKEHNSRLLSFHQTVTGAIRQYDEAEHEKRE